MLASLVSLSLALGLNASVGLNTGVGLNSSSSDPAYDVSRAHLFYELSGASYCQNASIASWSCIPCGRSKQSVVSNKVFYDKRTGARGFAGAFSDASGTTMIVFSFRGSEGLNNWLENLHFAKTDHNMSCAGCKVHSGFYDCWKALKDHGIVVELRRLIATYPSAKVFMTGHSLGAAIAMLAAYELQYEFKIPVDGAWTFGQPRVGNQAFRDFYNDNSPRVTWRLTHWRDPVPHVPLKSMGFSHIGNEVWYNEDFSTGKVCDGSGEDPTCSNSLDFETSVYDHLHYFEETTGENGCGDEAAVMVEQEA